MHAFVLDLRPLVDDGEDEEAENHDREADLQSKAYALASRGLGPDLGPCVTEPVEEWLLSLHSPSP
jgi:hypothetical protein